MSDECLVSPQEGFNLSSCAYSPSGRPRPCPIFRNVDQDRISSVKSSQKEYVTASRAQVYNSPHGVLVRGEGTETIAAKRRER